MDQRLIGRGGRSGQALGRRTRKQVVRGRADIDQQLSAHRAVDRLPRRLGLQHVHDSHGGGVSGAGRRNRLGDQRQIGPVVDRQPAAIGINLDAAGAGAGVDDFSNECESCAGPEVGGIDDQLTGEGVEGDPDQCVAQGLGLELSGVEAVKRVGLATGQEVGAVGFEFGLQGRGQNDRLVRRGSRAHEHVTVDIDRVRDDGHLAGNDRGV